jgi:hypothetical protein
MATSSSSSSSSSSDSLGDSLSSLSTEDAKQQEYFHLTEDALRDAIEENQQRINAAEEQYLTARALIAGYHRYRKNYKKRLRSWKRDVLRRRDAKRRQSLTSMLSASPAAVPPSAPADRHSPSPLSLSPAGMFKQSAAEKESRRSDCITPV